MKTIQELLHILDEVVDGGSAPKHEIRSQVSFISREVAVLEAGYASLAASHTQLEEEHAKLQKAKAAVDAKLAQLKLPPPEYTPRRVEVGEDW